MSVLFWNDLLSFDSPLALSAVFGCAQLTKHANAEVVSGLLWVKRPPRVLLFSFQNKYGTSKKVVIKVGGQKKKKQGLHPPAEG